MSVFLRLAILGCVALVAAGVASATARTDGATIHACANNTNGLLRKVPSADACRTHETAVTWGAAGADGVSGWELVTASTAEDLEPEKTLAVACSAGKKVLGGGGVALKGAAPEPLSIIRASAPLADGSGWEVRAFGSTGTGGWRLEVRATCAFVL